MKNYIRKADIILFIVLVAVGIAASVALSMSQAAAGSGAKVVIESGGELFASYSLFEDTDIIVPAPSSKVTSKSENSSESEAASSAETDPAEDEEARDECTQYDRFNEVVIKGGEVYVSEASCKNQICVKRGHISKAGESIVCLPNRLVVRIENSEGGGYDDVTS